MTVREALLKGYNIEMKDLSPDGNSNGIWPYKLLIELRNCVNSNENLTCELVFELNRAWNVATWLDVHFRRKYNAEMHYEVDVDFVVIHANQNSLEIVNHDIQEDSFTQANRLNIPKEINIRNETKSTDPTNTQFNVGITSFGWELTKYDNYAVLGRYIGGLEFLIENPRIEEETALLKMQSNQES